MKIAMINGSPKTGKSTSELLLNYLSGQLDGDSGIQMTACRLKPKGFTMEERQEIAECEALVLAFPLYVDSIPSHVLRMMMTFEKEKLLRKGTRVYCLVNNGFFEGRQNHIAIRQAKHWCAACGAEWGQALGAGAGEMLPFLTSVPLGHGPNKNLGRAIQSLAENIRNRRSGEDMLISPNYPRFLWRVQGTYFVWHSRARKNGVKPRELSKRAE